MRPSGPPWPSLRGHCCWGGLFFWWHNYVHLGVTGVAARLDDNGGIIQVTESGKDVVLRIDVTSAPHGWADTVYVDYRKGENELERVLVNDARTTLKKLHPGYRVASFRSFFRTHQKFIGRLLMQNLT